MQPYPTVRWDFRVSMSGLGPTMEEAFEQAILNNGLEPDNAGDCEPVILRFDCPCGHPCVAVQSWEKCDLENEFARDYVCKADGRRWTVDFEGEVYEHDLWVVLTETSEGWKNVWFTDEGSAETQQMPSTFRTQYEAYAELSEHLHSCWEAFVKGDMVDFPSTKEFKVVTLRSYLNLDEMEINS